ncbi:MFS transporter [Hymenobacter sp. BT439]|uniref:MFS transporter n=1 Tax=Hymenobacter properus TaxID=2791026 RepID=A0A931BE15_9BACT|nr:MFS transporter [Hymenobacter properus]
MNKKLITYLVSFAAFFGPFTQSIYTPLLPQVKQQFQASEYLVNLTISIFTVVMALMQVVYGPLVDNVGRKKMLLPGVLLYVLASVGAAYATTMPVLLALRVLQAGGIAVGSVVATTVIGDLFGGAERGRAMGTFQMLVALGPAVGPVIGGFVGQYFGLRGVFWVLASAGLLLLLLSWVYVVETRPEAPGRRFSLRDFGAILAQPVGRAVIALGFFQYFTFYTFLVFLPALLVAYYQLTPSQNGLAFLPLSLGVVLGSLVGGRVQERFSARQFLVVAASLNVGATLAFAAAVPVGLPVLLACMALFGLCLGLSLPVQTTLLANDFPQNRATAMGLYNFFRFLGMAAGPMVGTFFYHLGNRLEFVVAAAVFAVAVLFAARQFRQPTLSAT